MSTHMDPGHTHPKEGPHHTTERQSTGSGGVRRRGWALTMRGAGNRGRARMLYLEAAPRLGEVAAPVGLVPLPQQTLGVLRERRRLPLRRLRRIALHHRLL